jgi:hypothetical protein
VWAEQAIFTSMPRRGRAGYHVVARSPGVTEAEATAVATWSPSHGALIVDASNGTSVNFHRLPSGRLALSRTCEGPAEYSGRGERQIYTHALIFDAKALQAMGGQPIAVYRDALALGYLRFQAEPDLVLKPVELGTVHASQDLETWAARARVLGLPSLESLEAQLASGEPVQLRYPGDRIALAECLLGLLPVDMIPDASFSTSLRPSAVRPFRLALVS